MSDIFLLRYCPERASPIELFQYFGVHELSIDRQGRVALTSIISRLEKSAILWSHFLKICETVQLKESEELNRYGYSNAELSKLASAIFEAILNEYYSIYSNFAIIVDKIFKLGSSKGKWSKLKKKAVEGKYSNIPKEIIDLFKSITIDEALRKIRTESAHYSTGYINIFSKPYSYLNEQVGPIGKTPDNVLLIADIEEFYSRLSSETVDFLNRFFQYVMDNMIEGKKRILHICGFYRGYVYQRYESYLDFKSGKRGVCNPIWMSQDSCAPPCPLAKECKAYQNYLECHKTG